MLRCLRSGCLGVAWLVVLAGCGDARGRTGQAGTGELMDPEAVLRSTFALATCGGSDPVACGATARDQCTLNGSRFDSVNYSCLAASVDLGGSEWVQSFTASGPGDIVLSAAGADAYPFIAVLRDDGAGPDPTACVSANWYSVRLSPGVDYEPGDKFYLVVDHGTTGKDLAFDLSVDCSAATTETACDDLFDNDADYRQDCQDPDCVGTSACSLCQAAADLALGATHVPGDTAAFGSTDAIDRYACLPSIPSTSREYVYQFQPTATQDVLFTASSAGRYPLLTILRDSGSGCMAGDCIAANYYSVVFNAEVGQTYYLVVDGDDDRSFNYNVSLLTPQASEATCNDNIDNDGDALIDCDDTDCTLDAVCRSQPCATMGSVDCSTRLLHGDTGTQGAARISEYSCMQSLDLGYPEVGYTFRYTSGPAEQDVLLTLSNESSYAVVTAMNDLSVVEMEVTIKNGSNSDWSTGLLSLRPLITTGLAPQPGQSEYYTYTFANTECNLSDKYCGTGCVDDGNAWVLATRWGLTLGTDAWLVPALARGKSATIRVKAKASQTLSYVARVQGSVDDLMAMHVVGNTAQLSVPLSDANGDGLDSVSFGISGYDVNSSSRTDGSGNSCSAQCPAPRTRCYVAGNNGTTGGAQPGGQSASQEVACNPSECVGGNFYSARFRAKINRTYYLAVEGAYEANVTYDLSVVCGPSATESACDNGIDDDGDYLPDCADPDCDAACSHGNACLAARAIDCNTQLLAGSTSDPAATNGVDGYDCVLGLAGEGPEYTYKFVAPRSEWVNFTTSDLTAVVSVAVLEDNGSCDPHDAVDAQYYGVVAYVEAGKTYNVVVDTEAADQTADYSLSVVCNPAPRETSCTDNIDNDGDRLADCYDPDCGCA